jgi:predicted enzyme related to lactoylglutathione lyase
MLSLNSIMVGTGQLQAMAEFYQRVFARAADMVEEGSEYGWRVGNTFFLIFDHSEMTASTREPGRMMCNFETEQVGEEFKRISALGATVVREPYEMSGLTVATFADPDGNYFQLMSSFEHLVNQ